MANYRLPRTAASGRRLASKTARAKANTMAAPAAIPPQNKAGGEMEDGPDVLPKGGRVTLGVGETVGAEDEVGEAMAVAVAALPLA